MSFADSIADDLFVVDDLRAVTLKHRSDAGLFDEAPVTKALRTAISRAKQVLLQLPLDRVACHWHVAASELGGAATPFVPAIGDLVVEGDDTWAVDSVETLDEGRRYRLTCLKEIINV